MRQSPFLLRLELLIGSLAILVLAQAFNGGLSLATLDTLSTRSIVSSARVVGNDLALKLEGAVRYGKSLESFYGMSQVLDGLRKDMPELSGAYVSTPDGTVVHSLSQELFGASLSDLTGPLPPKALGQASNHEPVVLSHLGKYFVILPIRGPDNALAGTLALAFPAAVVDQRIEQGLEQNLRVLVISTAGAALLLTLGLFFFLHIGPYGGFSKARLYAVLLVALGGAQIFYSANNIQFFREQYLDIARTTARQLTSLVERDIEALLNKGVSIEKLRNIEEPFARIISATPEVQDIAVLSVDSRVLNLADEDGAVTDPQTLANAADADLGYAVALPLEREVGSGEVSEGFIQVRLSKPTLAAAIREIIMDAGTVAVIAILFLVEMTILFMVYVRKAAARRPGTLPAAGGGKPDAIAAASLSGQDLYGVIRPVAFLFLFAIDMSLSFIPLRMEELYTPMLGLSKDIILGLPISVEMGAAGVMVALSGPWIDKRGWLEPFVAGLVLCAAGYFFSGAADSAMEFTAARGFVGLGYGLGLMATQGFVIANTGPGEKARGITHMFAGVYAGSLCGGAAGAMLAQRMGYAPVFYVASAILVLVVLFAVLCLRATARTRAPSVDVPRHETPARLTLGRLLRFMTNRDVFALTVLSILPSALVLIGFLNYLLPIYLKRTGATQSDIGRILMIYGVCLIYVAPYIGRLVDESSRKRFYIVLSGVIGATGMMIYYIWGGLPAAALAVLLLGLSASFGFASQNAYALNLRITRDLGESTAIGLTNAVERLGQVLGPLLFGWIIAVAGLQHGVTLTGVGYLALTILFVFMAREVRIPVRAAARE